jgi:hypothetical protein
VNAGRGRAVLAIAGVAVLFTAALGVQRCRSPFLRIEGERDAARAIASEIGLRVAEVMALRELLGVTVSLDELRRRARDLVAARTELGSDDLAVLCVVGERELALRLSRAAGGDADAAQRALAPLPEAIHAVRFRAMVERFADRLPAGAR